MSKIAIRIKNASKYYKLYHEPKDRLKEALHPFGKSYHKPFYALNDINLNIQSGEIVGIVGRNGSGKSTLLKLITGVLTPNTGTVSAHGKISALLELGAGFNPEFSGLQNIYFYGTILGLGKQEIADRLDDIIAFAELGDFIEQPLKTYSSGMKSRLGFAVAVHIDPEILILDEVLSVGDVLFKRKCYAKMEEFFKGGKTIIYVSHDANSIQTLCTRAIFLDSGSILLDGDAKTVMTYYQKYLFAKDENRAKVKDEIRQLKEQGVPAVKHNQFQKDMEVEINAEAEEPQTEDEEYFIPDLTPKSTVEYKNYPVEIFDTCIKNNRLTKVNVLKMNRDYYFSAKIKFDVDAEKVGFSFTIKNEKGMNISSCKTLEADYTDARKDSIYQVDWHFINKLLPGIYYMNIGLRSFPEGKESFILNRIIDVFVFKVNQDRVINIGGIVALDQKMKIAEIEYSD